MRLLIDTLIAVMLAAILAGLVIQYRQENRQDTNLQSIHDSLARLRQEIYYRGALGGLPMSQRGFPRLVSPTWFAEGLPFNTLVPGRQPWIDIAGEDDKSDQPPDPIIRRPDQAGFWYNPNLGIFRARVRPQDTMSDTLKLYNDVNGTALPELVERVSAPRPQDATAMVPTDGDAAADIDTPVADTAPVKHKVPTLRDQDP